MVRHEPGPLVPATFPNFFLTSNAGPFLSATAAETTMAGTGSPESGSQRETTPTEQIRSTTSPAWREHQSQSSTYGRRAHVASREMRRICSGTRRGRWTRCPRPTWIRYSRLAGLEWKVITTRGGCSWTEDRRMMERWYLTTSIRSRIHRSRGLLLRAGSSNEHPIDRRILCLYSGVNRFHAVTQRLRQSMGY